jgi:thiamine biosynthesis lipoprotein
MAPALARRRFLGISAAAAGFALLPFGRAAGAAPAAVVWRGRALGAPAELILNHPDPALAQRLARRAAAEIARLEQIFSLYLPDSALSRLNRQGALAVPPSELVELLHSSRAVWELSDGAFDPTVQPLWLLHARHFSVPDADPAGPPRADVEAVLGRVGFGRLAFDDSRVAFPSKGMSLTLNGIAQGFITDRIVDMLRDAGMTSTLADIGEVRAIGRRADASPWRVGIGGTAYAVDLVDRAVATSSPEGFRFAGPASPAHLLDPRSGRSAGRYRNVSVLAADATTADALSTACCFLDRQAVAALTTRLPAIEIHLQMHDGRRVHFG